MTSDGVRLGSGISGFFSGAVSVFRGLGRLLGQPKLRKLAVTPLIITLVLYAVVFAAAAFFSDDVLARVWTKPESGLLLYVWYVLVPIIFVALVIVLALLFVSIASLVSGPFYEKMVMHILAEHGVEARDVGIVKGAIYEIGRALVFIIPAALFAAVGFLLGFIPFLGVPFVLLATATAWLGLASTAINPALVATGRGSGEQIRFVFRSLMVMLGIGTILGVSLLVPILGLLAVPSAVIGATELYARAVKTTLRPQAA